EGLDLLLGDAIQDTAVVAHKLQQHVGRTKVIAELEWDHSQRDASPSESETARWAAEPNMGEARCTHLRLEEADVLGNVQLVLAAASAQVLPVVDQRDRKKPKATHM